MFNEATIGVMLFSLVHRDEVSRNIKIFPIGCCVTNQKDCLPESEF
jgi:hypothetical protein